MTWLEFVRNTVLNLLFAVLLFAIGLLAIVGFVFIAFGPPGC